MKIALNILSALFGLFMINGGLNKFLNYMPAPDSLPEPMMKDSEAMMEIVWLMPLVAIAEIIGGLLIIIPKTRALGALIILPVMTGVLLTHLTVARETLGIALVLWAILLWILIDNRRKYAGLIGK